MANFCFNCGNPIQPHWKVCPYCAQNLKILTTPAKPMEKATFYEPIPPYSHIPQVDILSSPYVPPSSGTVIRKGLTKTQKKAILITTIIVLAGVITGVSLYFGLNMVRTINFYVDNGPSSRSYTYTLPRAEFDTVSNWDHPSHSYSNWDSIALAIESYCTPDSAELQKIGQDIISQCVNQNDDEEILNGLLSFAQGITYKSETVDLAQYPLETIFNQGDCEDLCIFFGSLVEAVGYEAILLCVEIWDYSSYEWLGHVQVGVYLPFTPTEHGGTSFYYDVSGSEYWICETTDQGWMVGELPAQDPSDINIHAYVHID